MSHLIKIHYPGALLDGQYLQGPRTPQQVARNGYGFTPDPTAAWPFPTRSKAQAKARIVDLHMGWSPSLVVTH